MFRLSGRRQAETLLRPLMRFHLGHDGFTVNYLGRVKQDSLL
jgi:hypothetical protein